MVSTRRQIQGLQNGESLALRSRTTPENHKSVIAESAGEREEQPAKKMRMAGVIIPPRQNSPPSSATRSPEPEILDSQIPGHLESPNGMTESQVSEALDNPSLVAGAESAESKIRDATLRPAQPVDVIQAATEHHVRVKDDAHAEPYTTSSITLGRPGEVEPHLTSEDSDEEEPPESATTARIPGQSTLHLPKARKPKNTKLTTTASGNEGTHPKTSDRVVEEQLKGKSPDEKPNVSGSNLEPRLHSLESIGGIAREKKPVKLLHEKPRKDVVKDGVTYRFRPADENVAGKLPAKQNPISRQLKESLLERKRIEPAMKSKFVRA